MVFLAQLCTYVFLHLPLKFILRADVQGIEQLNIDDRRAIIIAANHHAKIDPFLIYLLPFSLLLKIIPFYQPTNEYHYHKWWFKIFILLGAYPIKRRAFTYEDLLGSTEYILKKGHSVMIFPEAQIVTPGSKVEAKPGIIYMAKHTDAQIVPMYIKGSQQIGLRDIFMRKVKIILTMRPIFPIVDTIDRKENMSLANKLMYCIYHG